VLDVFGPSCQSAPTLVEIDRFVVDAGDPALVTTDVAKDDLDDVRRHTESLVQCRR
jgi:hypothetical protein